MDDDFESDDETSNSFGVGVSGISILSNGFRMTCPILVLRFLCFIIRILLPVVLRLSTLSLTLRLQFARHFNFIRSS